MYRLTVLYNLPPGADEAAFLEWRLNEHQRSNESNPGVVSTSFYRVESSLNGETPPYRFMTTVDWNSREEFERTFYHPDVQAKLQEDLKRITDVVFLESELLVAK